MAMKRCPVCGVSVKVENLERHVKNQHPHATFDLRSVMSEDERREIEAAKGAGQPVITRKGLRLVAIVAVVLAVILLIAVFNPFRGVGPSVGQTAPDFSLQRSDSGTFRLSSARGSVVLLEFMDVDCEFCQQEAPVLASVFSTYSGRGVRFVSVDANFVGQDDTSARIEQFKTTYATNWIYVIDSSRSTVNAYGVSATPTTFILDRNGVVTKVYTGLAPGGASDFAAALDAALG